MLGPSLTIRRGRWVRTFALWATIAACVAGQVFAGESRPVSSPANRTSKDPCAPSSAAAGERRTLPTGGTVGEGLMLTEQESQVLAGVEDRTGQLLDDPALYMMLARAASLPPLSAEQLSSDLDWPAYRNLLTHPELYRARPMGMRVRVRLIKKLQPAESARRDRRDPNEGPLWCLECYNVSPKRGASEPVIVLSTTPPALGKPDKVNPDGVEVYDRSVPEVELAGLFHKLYSVQDPNGQRCDYPVVLAWQLDRKSHTTVGPNPFKTFFVVAIVLLGYGVLRRQLKRRASQSRGEDFLHPRVPASETVDNAQAGQVDPLLIQAAQEHQRQRRSQDGTDSKG